MTHKRGSKNLAQQPCWKIAVRVGTEDIREPTAMNQGVRTGNIDCYVKKYCYREKMSNGGRECKMGKKKFKSVDMAVL